MRSQAVATAYFENLRKVFTANVYKNAALRARGLSPSNNVYMEFQIFQQTLSENELYGLLDEKSRDALIDFLIQQTL